MHPPTIGILKTGSTRLASSFARRGGDYDAWFRAALEPLGVRCVTVDAVAGPLPESIDWAGCVITGSPHAVHDRAPWSEAAAAWVAARIIEGLPTLGVCYGHQLIAHALGGATGPNPGGPEIGAFQIERVADDPLLEGLPEPFFANLIHYNAVTAMPPGARVLAKSARCAVQAFAIGDHVRGVQWHPEFDSVATREAVRQDALALAARGIDPVQAEASVRPLPYRELVLRNFATRFVLPATR